MMPPSTGLPLSHRAGAGSAAGNGAETSIGNGVQPVVEEHTIQPPDRYRSTAGVSSDEPAAETTPAGDAFHNA